MFGGFDKGTSHLYDTWEFDGYEWVQVPTNMPEEEGRVNISQAMVYDTLRKKTILFGGKTENGRLDDTWEYDGKDWVEVTVSIPPPGRDGHALAYDTERNLTIMFGGYNHVNPYMNDTWEYDGSDWIQIFPDQSPPGRNHHSITYDSQRGVIILFGGEANSGDYLGDTWEYDGTTWKMIATSQTPPARKDHSLAYDASRSVVVLFGGLGGTSDEDSSPMDDTWEYDGNTWYQVDAGVKPDARLGFPMVYDSLRERIILFSGGYLQGNLKADDDTWCYAGGGCSIPTHKFYIPLIARDL